MDQFNNNWNNWGTSEEIGFITSSVFDDDDTFNNADTSSIIGEPNSSPPIVDYDTAFARHVGMNFSQVNAQKILGPPFEHEGPPPTSGSELYVRNLPMEPPSCIPEIFDLFKQMGRVYTIRLLVNFSGLPKGYGFVCFYSSNDAERALVSLNGHHLRYDKPMHVQMSVDNHVLTISDIPGDKTDEAIVEEVTSVSGGDVREVKVRRACFYPRSKLPKEMVTVTIHFSSHKSASNARRDFLTGRSRLWGQVFSAEWTSREEITSSSSRGGRGGGRGRQPQRQPRFYNVNTTTTTTASRNSYRKF